jgi:hypothetical protein
MMKNNRTFHLSVVTTALLLSLAVGQEPPPLLPQSLLSCTELGWTNPEEFGNTAVCSQVADGANEVCSDRLSFADATAHCEDMGARICTVEEMRDGEMEGSICGYAWTWSSTECAPESVFAKDFISGRRGCVDASSTSTRSFRAPCCGDIPKPPPPV